MFQAVFKFNFKIAWNMLSAVLRRRELILRNLPSNTVR